jgi:hypothetical protein
MATAIDELLSLRNNAEYVEGLVEQLRDGPGVTPFVGAGMSAQLELPQWGEFLVGTARRFHDEPRVTQLVETGLYEEAAEVCIEGSGPGGLQHSISEEFGDKKLDAAGEITGALRVIPRLAGGPVVTTNFDHALERVFRQVGKSFLQVLWGDSAALMIDAFQRNRRYLFKIHGDVDRPDQRILTRAEYDQHYGEPGAGGKARPLHRVIEIAMANRPLLFLGCSLKSDRIVGFLEEFYAEYQRLMHYAIVWRPDEDDAFRERDRQLTRLGVMPIWYPRTDHGSIETILRHVLERAGQRKARTTKAATQPAGRTPTPAQIDLARRRYDELAALGAAPLLEGEYTSLAASIARGETAWFVGWGAHYPLERLADSTPATSAQLAAGSVRRPGAPRFWQEVAAQLARETGYDEPIDTVADLTRLMQYIYEVRGEVQLEHYMREELGAAYTPTLAHWFLAGLPGLLREKNSAGVAPLILTANQDDVLERAFEALGEPLDTLAYIARGPDQGRFFYRPALSPPVMIRTARQARQVAVKERALLVKLHGSIDRRNPEAEKLVLTEDDHLSYLARLTAEPLLPPAIDEQLVRSRIMFIGYALRDWTIRVLLKQVWSKQRPRIVSSAILLNAGTVTRMLLTKQGVNVVDKSWENVLAGLVEAMRALPPSAAR